MEKRSLNNNNGICGSDFIGKEGGHASISILGRRGRGKERGKNDSLLEKSLICVKERETSWS